MTEKEIRDIVKSMLRSQMLDVPSKAEVKKIAKEEAEKASNNAITQKEVKDIIKKTMHSYHKWMWEKKGMWIDQI